MRFLIAVLLLLCVSSHVGAQSAPPAAAPPATTLTPAQAQAVLNVLQDDKARAQFTAVLQDMVRANPAAAPAKPSVVPLAADSVGAQLLVAGSHWASELAAQFSATSQAIGDVPLLWRWVEGTATDAAARARVLETGWRLVVIALVAWLVEWGARAVLRRPRRLLAARAPADEPVATDLPDGQQAAQASKHPGFSVAWRMLRRLPFVLIALILDLIPVVVFAAVGHAMLTTPLGVTTNTRLVVLAIVDAYVVCRVIMCITRSFVSPTDHRLRLIQCDDQAAEFIENWVRWISVVAVFGFATAQVGSLFGLYRSAYDVLIKLVALVVHVMLVIVVVQSRHGVAHRLRARKNKKGLLASLQNHFAANWHLIAIFYIVALWLVAAAEIRDGYERLLHFFIVTVAVSIVARLLAIVLLGGLDRSLRIGSDTSSRFPGLEQRLIYYYPALRVLVIVVVAATTFVALLEVWGFAPLGWFAAGALGERLLSALGTSGIAVLVAVMVWEAANAGVENKVASLTRAAQTARAARLRTLLPMLRTGLFVAILIVTGLIVLSQIGLNIAPLLAGAGVLGVAIGFGSQKLVQDLITGLFLLLENTMQVGDVVTLGGLSGTVEYLSIRTIRLRAIDGSVHIIPFSSVTTVTNQTRDFAYAVFDLPIGLNEEPDAISDLLRTAAKAMRAEPRWEDVITSDLDVMGVYAFTDTAWTLRVRLRTTASQRWAVNREFNRRV
ncbi:mechanosensitive ion channel domain-containing protein, partial [Acidisphaera sp. L21]|uniref:mechanosensitive ion channel domain-containing protein n=1 Tax=Acidisphaera sp. L21 TaxID=1641851 RepID=UPI00131C53CF